MRGTSVYDFRQLKDFYLELEQVSLAVSALHSFHPCHKGCSQCCGFSCFLVSETEAAYLIGAFRQLPIPKRQRREIRAKASSNVNTMRRLAGYQGWPNIVAQLKAEPSQCPLLTGEGACLLYEYRPSTCRAYGNWIFPENSGVYACQIVELAFKLHAQDGIKLPSFDFVAKRQEQVLRGAVMPLSAWLEM